MASTTFYISGEPGVQITVEEVPVGLTTGLKFTLLVKDEMASGETQTDTGDLRALFFDVADESLLGSLSVTGAHVTKSVFKADDVSDLGNGANMNGSGPDKFDVGIEIGSQGMSADDIQSTTFTMVSSSGPLSLSLLDKSLFAPGEGSIAVRMTSVGQQGGTDNERKDSLKLYRDLPDLPPPAPAKASLGDTVWEDTNGNGVQDSGELGISGATVRLIDANGATVATKTTDTNGKYSFTDLTPGNYQVEFVTPTGYVPTGQDQGGSDTADSDAGAGGRTATVNLSAGENDISVDAGFYQPATVGDRVWLDTDGDGVQDAGEAGLTGVTVKLVNAAGTVVATTTTGANGIYGFANVAPGTYSVRFEAPAGYTFTGTDKGGNDTADSDANALGNTAPFTVTSGSSNLTLDAGLFQTASLGNRVWEDTNGNGIQDGEPGIAGATVRLLDANGNTIATRTTDTNGNYSFTGLIPGDYQVEFVTPAGYTPTGQNTGSDDEADSDAGAGGRTATVNLTSGENDTSVDAGFTPPPSPPPPPPPPPVTDRDDLIEGGDGNDLIHGGEGNDEIQGEGGDDLIIGGTDNGTITNTGNARLFKVGDNLYGNDGRDKFVYAKGDGVDLIWDFQPGSDTIRLHGFTSAEASSVEIVYVKGIANAIGTGNHNKIAIVFNGDTQGA
ncbi:MAG TPA: SdrD B-like domain-containing protein, partial [Microvirga sp.]|nr:SdrD B-like domain-containing protein [Microvirga sp.]